MSADYREMRNAEIVNGKGMSLFALQDKGRQGSLPKMISTADRRDTIAAPTPLIAIGSVIVSMSLVAIGNGLMFAYIPVRLAADGFAPAWAGSIVTAMSAGGIAGCLFTGPLVQRVGHARTFMVFLGIIALSNCGIGAGVYPWLWIAARALYGLAICGLFVVGQSWLNDVVNNDIRGRVMAAFYVSYVCGLGVGYMLMGFVDLNRADAALISIACAAVSVLPVGLTRLAQPPPPQAASLGLLRAWQISPVGVVGMLAVGGLSLSITGFAPIHAAENGYTQQQVATLMSAIPLGTILLQIPFGWLSDRTDRRYVIFVTSVIALGSAMLALGFDGSALTLLVPIYVIWDGASESIYSLANAHASDRASRDDMVSLSAAMLFAWSVSGFVIPGIVTILTAWFGTEAFMYAGIVIAAAYATFVLWRIATVGSVPRSATGTFAPMTAQAPLPVDLVMDDRHDPRQS